MAPLKVSPRASDIGGVSALLIVASSTGAGVGLSDVLGGVLNSLLDQVASTSWLGLLLGLMVGRALVTRVRVVVHGRHRRDPQRCFLRADKRLILERAGQRCEHHTWLDGRCRATDDLQADHVHPHCRGGSTSVANGQALCPRHNTQKAAHVPWNWELKRLAWRRRSYFPAGMPTAVVRRQRQGPAPSPVLSLSRTRTVP